MDLAELINNEVTLDVDVGAPEPLTVVYRPAAHTYEIEAGILRPSNGEYLERMLVRWALKENGEPVPIEFDRILDLPATLVAAVVNAVIEDQAAGKGPRSASSPDGSAAEDS